MAEPELAKQPDVTKIKCKECDYTADKQHLVDSHYRMKHDPEFAAKRKAYQEAAKVVKAPQGRPPKALQPKSEPVKEAPKPKPAPVVEILKPSPAGEAKKAESFPAKPKWYEVDII
jgi:hypothetical protein